MQSDSDDGERDLFTMPSNHAHDQIMLDKTHGESYEKQKISVFNLPIVDDLEVDIFPPNLMRPLLHPSQGSLFLDSRVKVEEKILVDTNDRANVIIEPVSKVENNPVSPKPSQLKELDEIELSSGILNEISLARRKSEIDRFEMEEALKDLNSDDFDDLIDISDVELDQIMALVDEPRRASQSTELKEAIPEPLPIVSTPSVSIFTNPTSTFISTQPSPLNIKGTIPLSPCNFIGNG